PLAGPRERPVEQPGLACPDLVPDRIRPGPVEEQREAAGVADGQGPEDQAVEDREERRVGADAERERHHGDGGKAGTSSKLADAVPQILREFIDDEVPAHPRLLALVLMAAVAPCVFPITEPPKR